MKILLSKNVPKSAILVATTEDDLRTLRILFNHRLIRYAYLFWRKKDGCGLAESYKFLEKYNPLAYLSIHGNEPIEDSTREEKASKFREEMEKKVKDREISQPADELSDFLEGGSDG